MQGFVADDGEEIHYVAGGSGPPVVLLHEWASSHHVWEPVARRLEPRFRVVRWDARGHGGHRRRSAVPITIARMAEDLALLLGQCGPGRPIVAAHSMAALITWEYVRRHGCGAIAGLVIVDMTPKPVTDDAWRLGVFGDWPAARDRAFVEEMRTDFADAVVAFVARGLERRGRASGVDLERMRRTVRTLDAAPLIEIWQSIMAGDWRDVLAMITVPALLVYGAESTFYSVETARFVRDAIPDAVLEVYGGADHFPHLADPERFVADLTAFAARILPPPAPWGGRAAREAC